MVESLDVGPPVLRDLACADGVAIDAPCLAIGFFLHGQTMFQNDAHVGASSPRDAYRISIESPILAACVPQDRIVLAAEPSPALAADRVAPHDLVDEQLATEQPVERDLDVVHRAIIEVDEHRAVFGKRPPALLE